MFIIIAILGFGLLIFVHELGHFLAARACGVRVNEFALGMGPTIFKKQGKETLFSLRAFPLGGFCAMEGEDEESADPRAFSAQKTWKKLIILVSGAGMNFVLGFVLVLIVFAGAAGFSVPIIDSFMENCPYEGEDALMVGDTIYSIDGHRIYFTGNVSTYMTRSASDHHDIVVIRDGEKLRLDDYYMPLVEYPTADGGTELKYGLYFSYAEAGFFPNLKYSFYTTLDFVRLVWMSLVDLVTGAVGLDQLGGAVLIVDQANQIGKQSPSFLEGLQNVTYLFSLIAVNLAVMNLLPIPALDGGRVFFLIVTWCIEKIKGSRLDPKYEGYIHTAGFVLLMGLMVVIMANDILRIIRR